LRYQGFIGGELDLTDEVSYFCKEKLRDATPQYAWCIAESAEVLRSVKPDVLSAARQNLLIWLTYGPFTRNLGARVWGTSPRALRNAAAAAAEIAQQVNQEWPVISVEYDESDYTSVVDGKTRRVDFNLLTDQVRISAAEVLNLLFEHCNGPPAERWGGRFDDLRYGLDMRATIPARHTRVRWYDPGAIGGSRHQSSRLA